MEIKFKLNDSNTPGMRTIPNSDIQAREINASWITIGVISDLDNLLTKYNEILLS